jgi:hypothetical protein
VAAVGGVGVPRLIGASRSAGALLISWHDGTVLHAWSVIWRPRRWRHGRPAPRFAGCMAGIEPARRARATRATRGRWSRRPKPWPSWSPARGPACAAWRRKRPRRSPLLGEARVVARRLLERSGRRRTGGRRRDHRLRRGDVGPPAIDLGSFLAQLARDRTLGRLTPERVEVSGGALIDGYGAAPPALGACVAAGLVRLAPHVFRERDEAWPERTEAVVAAAERALGRPSRRSQGRWRRDGFRGGARAAAPAVAHPLDDPAFGFLASAFDPTSATPVLARALGTTLGAPVRAARATPFRHRAGRRTLVRFDLETDAGPRRVLGKVRAKGADRRTQRFMAELRRAGFDETSQDGIAVPAPLAVVDAGGWWSTRGSRRRRRRTCGRSPTPRGAGTWSTAWATRWRSSARWARGRRGAVHGLDDELEALRRQLAVAASSEPALAPRFGGVMTACARLAAHIPPAPMGVAHRDFYGDQVLVAGERTYLVDLDLAARAHPALDVGNLAAHLVEHALRVEGDAHAFDDLVARAVRPGPPRRWRTRRSARSRP